MATGNDYVLLKGAVGSEQEIVGQLDGTLTVINTNPSIANKSNGGAEEYLGEAVGKQVTYAGTLTQINTAIGNEVKAAIESGILEPYTIQALNGESWSADFMVGSRTDTATMNGAVTMAFTASSSGGYTYTPPTDPV